MDLRVHPQTRENTKNAIKDTIQEARAHADSSLYLHSTLPRKAAAKKGVKENEKDFTKILDIQIT